MKYSTKEVAKILQVADRTVRRYLQNLITYTDKGIEVDEAIVEILKKKHSADRLRTTSGQAADTEEIETEYDIVEGFSNEEYQEFQKRLIEYPILKEELEYHKKSAQRHQDQMEKILSIMQERNLIEATDKKYLDKPPRNIQSK